MVLDSISPRRCRLWLWFALAALGCGTPEAVSDRPHNIDLLERLEQADVSLSGLDLITGPLEPAFERDLLAVDEMDATAGSRWWFEDSVAEETRRALPLGETAGESVLVLEASDSPLALLLPSDTSSHYRVQIRWRAGEGSRGGLAMQALSAAPTGFDDLDDVRDFVRRQRLKGKALSSVRTPLNPGDGWQESEIFVGRENGRRSILLRLRSFAGSVDVDRIEVRRLSNLESSVEIAEPEPGRSPLYRRLQLPTQSSECLLLPAGTSVGFSVVVPPSGSRFDTETRILGNAAARSEIIVRVNGEEVGRRSATRAPGPGGAPWQIPLDQYAGQRVDLELTLEGPRRTVGALTAPRLLGAGDTRPAVVLISLDTLRADHLGPYGETRPLSPSIDRLAQQGTVFERVVSPASYTLPTHATILTGQHPLVHGVHRRHHRIGQQRSELLASRLRSEGYLTAAFTGGGYVSPVFGFSRGFDQYSTRDPGVTEHRLAEQRKGLAATELVENQARMDPVLDWMERYQDQPYFLFVHSYLVHGYFPQQAYLDRVGAGLDLDPANVNLPRLWEQADSGDEAATEALRALYAATVAQADDLIVRPLLEAIERRNEAGGETLVVLVSDHGEQLREHGQLGHGGALWRELIHVPWILRGPGVAAGQRWPDPVELADVAPTILRYLDLPNSDLATGQPRLIPGSSPDPLEFVVHHEPSDKSRWHGLVTQHWKLLRHGPREEPAWYLFDLEQDPNEMSNLVELQPAVLEELQERLLENDRRLLRFGASLQSSDNEAELPASVTQELRALGYTDE